MDRDLNVKSETTKVLEKPKILTLVYIFKETFHTMGNFSFKLAHFPTSFCGCDHLQVSGIGEINSLVFSALSLSNCILFFKTWPTL